MSKRKSDCTLNEFVVEYLKNSGYDKSFKLITEKRRKPEESDGRICEKFTDYLKEKEAKTLYQTDDDLGFEINFGAYQPINIVEQPTPEKTKVGSKSKKAKNKGVPKEFIKKIKKLGMKVEDAELLYKTKIDWAAVYAENKLYCTEHGCDFFAKIEGEEMRNHMINTHKYGNFPCPYEDCSYVGISKVSGFQIDCKA